MCGLGKSLEKMPGGGIVEKLSRFTCTQENNFAPSLVKQIQERRGIPPPFEKGLRLANV